MSEQGTDPLPSPQTVTKAGRAGDGRDPLRLVGTTIDGEWQVESWIAANEFCAVYRAQPVLSESGQAMNRGPLRPACIRVFTSFVNTPLARREPLLASFSEVEARLKRLHERSDVAPDALASGSFQHRASWYPYLALEWVEGSSLLDALVAETKGDVAARPLAAAIDMLAGPARALEAAHDLGIVHLDLKPENIIVSADSDGTVGATKLLDFGVTRLVTGIGENHGERDRPRHATITPEYAAPEQYDHSFGPIGPQTDVFAFALVLLEVMRGGRSILGDGVNFDEAGIAEMRRRATDRVVRPSPSRMGLVLPIEVEAVFNRALSVDVHRRQPNMGAFSQLLLAAIDRAARGESGRGRGNTGPIPAPPTFAGSPEVTANPVGPSAVTSETLSGLPAIEDSTPEPDDAVLPATAPYSNTEVAAEANLSPQTASNHTGPEQAALEEQTLEDQEDLDGWATSGEIISRPRARGSVRVAPEYAAQTGMPPHPGDGGGDLAEELLPPRRSRMMLGIVAGGLLAATLGLVFMLRSGPKAETPTRGGQGPTQLQADAAPSTAPAGKAGAGEHDGAAVAAKPVPTGPHCPEAMALIPGGKFFMGSDSEHPALRAARPAHKVSIERFCLDRHEVTVADYRKCSSVGECKRAHRDSLWPQGKSDEETWRNSRETHSQLCTEAQDDSYALHPVNCVTWEMARDYCEYIGKRLPRESEWEFAARGSDGRIFPWGDARPDATRMNACGTECQAWRESRGLSQGRAMYATDDKYAGTAPVGSFPAGATQHGLHDMVGNVFEWTADEFRPYGAAAQPRRGRRKQKSGGDLGAKHVIRGGAFNSFVPEFSDPALRYGMAKGAHTHAIGFRCASEVIPGTAELPPALKR